MAALCWRIRSSTQNSAVRCVVISMGNIWVGMIRRTSVASGMVHRMSDAARTPYPRQWFYAWSSAFSSRVVSATSARLPPEPRPESTRLFFKCWSKLCNRRNHLTTSVTDSGKINAQANAPVFSGRKIFGGSWLAPINVGPMTRKPYHKHYQ